MESNRIGGVGILNREQFPPRLLARPAPLARYPFPWETVSAFVLREKAKGPPDDMVTLEVDGRT